ncbi:MAG TPA: tetratricopeptide repeat protein [Nevskiaceae bacterium]|nr:tetratricopeptide repeat protein [Nevskiaceae bacterium]
MRRALAAAVSSLLLAGCAADSQNRVTRQVEGEIAMGDPRAQQKVVHTDLIRNMLDQQQYYAAIAHIQAQQRERGDKPDPELQLLEATARRNLGQTAQAQDLYRQLLKSPFVAEAYHGLGLISARADLNTSVWQLRQAVQRKPTDAQMRNDLGYALMMAGRYNEALPELATAVELEAGSGSDKARNNLVLLMLVTGDEAAVQRLVQQSGMTDATLAGLRRQAQSLARKPLPKGTADRKG